MNPLQNSIPQYHLHNYSLIQNQSQPEDDSSLDSLETVFSQLHLEEPFHHKSIEFSIQQLSQHIDIFQKTNDIPTRFKTAKECWNIIRDFLVSQKSEIHRLPPLPQEIVLICVQEICISNPQGRPQELCLLFDYACMLRYKPCQFLSEALQILKKSTFIKAIPCDDSLPSRTALLHQVFVNQAFDALILLPPEDLIYLLGASYSLSSLIAPNKPCSISQIASVIKDAATIANIAFPEGSQKAQCSMSLLNVISLDLGIVCAHEYKKFIKEGYNEIVLISVYFKQILSKFQISSDSLRKLESLVDSYLKQFKELINYAEALEVLGSNPQFDISIDAHAKAILSPTFPENYVTCALHAHSIETDLKIAAVNRSKILNQILTQIFDPRFYPSKGKEVIRNILQKLVAHVEGNEVLSNTAISKQSSYKHHFFALFDSIFSCSIRTENPVENGNDLLLNLPIHLLADYCIGSYKHQKNLKTALEILASTKNGKVQLSTALVLITNSDELSSDLGENIIPFLGECTKYLEYAYLMKILNDLSSDEIKNLLEHLLPLAPSDEERNLAEICIINFLSGPLFMLEKAVSDETLQKRFKCEFGLLGNLQDQYLALKKMNSIGKQEVLPIWRQVQSIEMYVLEQSQTKFEKDLYTNQEQREIDDYNCNFSNVHEWLLKHPAYEFCTLWHEHRKYIQPTLGILKKILSKLNNKNIF